MGEVSGSIYGLGDLFTILNFFYGNPFERKILNIDENNKDFIINKMKNNNIERSSKYWNYKNNIVEINDKNSLDNSIENEDNDDNYEENIIKDNLDFEEIENNSEDIAVKYLEKTHWDEQKAALL